MDSELVVSGFVARRLGHHLKSASDRHLCADKQAGRHLSPVVSQIPVEGEIGQVGLVREGRLMQKWVSRALARGFVVMGRSRAKGNPKKAGRRPAETAGGQVCQDRSIDGLWRRWKNRPDVAGGSGSSRRVRLTRPLVIEFGAPREAPTGSPHSSDLHATAPLFAFDQPATRLARWAGCLAVRCQYTEILL